MKKRIWILSAAAVVTAGLYLANASWLAPKIDGKPSVLSHRGVYQRYDRTGLTMTTCTASRIFPPTHDFLENTLASMKASLEAGADGIEVDVHPTTDGQFVVFHDWTVDCRTEGHGNTRDHTLAELKALDIGYGYTADDGKTFPFRGRFKGQMPSLDEVLKAFPATNILINIKSNDASEADKLVAYLKAHNELTPRVSAYGGDRPLARLAVLAPSMRPFSKTTLKACAVRYIALGWSGYMPKACHNTVLFLPQNYTWLAWGYPNRLQKRFNDAGSYVYLLGPQKSMNSLAGINTSEELAKTPQDWRMGILTDSIETIGPEVRKNGKNQ